MPGPPPKLPELREDWERALCVAAHPDDLEYGAASAVARWTAQGKQVTYLLATRGEAGIDGLDPAECGPLREREEVAGAAEVGVSVVEFLDYRDGVVEYSLALRKDIARAVRKYRPQVVLTGGFDVTMIGGVLNQADHRAVGLATVDAARDAGNRWVFPELADEGLQPWGGVRYILVGGSDRPSHGVDVTDHLPKGIASLQAHKAYMDGLGDGSFDVTGFLTWIASASAERLDVEDCEAAVLFETYSLQPEGPMPWEQ
jgi:LmbE family N-acetylglucosaminyl deacetylase